MSQQSINVRTRSGSIANVAYLTRVLGMGMFFGLLLIKSEVVVWERIHKMFLFQEAHMYLIIGTAVIVGALSMLIIKRFEVKSVGGDPIVYQPKPYHKGVIFGGMAFGMGWAITGACPGPIYAQIGAGEPLAIITFLSALAGMYLYAYMKPKLPH